MILFSFYFNFLFLSDILVVVLYSIFGKEPPMCPLQLPPPSPEAAAGTRGGQTGCFPLGRLRGGQGPGVPVTGGPLDPQQTDFGSVSRIQTSVLRTVNLGTPPAPCHPSSWRSARALGKDKTLCRQPHAASGSPHSLPHQVLFAPSAWGTRAAVASSMAWLNSSGFFVP